MELATNQERSVKSCPWCNGSLRCATCNGTGKLFVKTRIFWRRRIECRACEGTGLCQLCKPHGAVAGS